MQQVCFVKKNIAVMLFLQILMISDHWRHAAYKYVQRL